MISGALKSTGAPLGGPEGGFTGFRSHANGNSTVGFRACPSATASTVAHLLAVTKAKEPTS